MPLLELNQKKFLFVCSDIGPLKYILKIAESFKFNNCIFFLSPLAEQYVANSCVKLELISCFPQSNCIKAVITGTTLDQNSLDRQALKWGKDNKIFTISIVEHWSWYAKRFLISKNNQSVMLLPDMIFVNDLIAFNGCVKDGIPSRKLKIVGNPYLESLCFADKQVSDRNALRAQYNIPQNKFIILFVSEEIASAFRPDSNDFLGYTEYDVLGDIIKSKPESSHIVIKLHPEENKDKYQLYSDITCIDSCPLNHTAVLPDRIVGMASMLLIELSSVRNDIISYRPSALKTFIGNTLGLTVPSSNSNELSDLFRESNSSINNFGQLFLGSQDKICSFLTHLSV